MRLYCQNAAVVSKAVADINLENDHRTTKCASESHGTTARHSGAFRVVALSGWMQERFGNRFNFLRQSDEGDEMGVLVLPSLERNSGPLYIAKIVREERTSGRSYGSRTEPTQIGRVTQGVCKGV